jgi:DNA polymerase V
LHCLRWRGDASGLRQQLLAAGLQVFLRTGFHDPTPYSNALALPLPTPSADSRKIIHLAKWLLRRIFRPGYPYQKAGVMLLDLASANRPQQGDLFNPPTDNMRLMQTVDGINQLLGQDRVYWAAQGVNRPWRMRMAHRSPRYTTCWKELPLAGASAICGQSP